jgi:hypothetical protein
MLVELPRYEPLDYLAKPKPPPTSIVLDDKSAIRATLRQRYPGESRDVIGLRVMATFIILDALKVARRGRPGAIAAEQARRFLTGGPDSILGDWLRVAGIRGRTLNQLCGYFEEIGRG